MLDRETLLQQAARLRTLVAIGRAKGAGQCAIQATNSTKDFQVDSPAYTEPEPDDQARTVAAELLHRVALDASGAPFDSSNPDMWEAEDDAEPEVISLGAVRFKVIDADSTELAIAAGAVEEDAPPALCLLVEFADDEGAPQPSTGQYVTVQADDGVALLFYVWLAHADLHDPAAPNLGPGAVRNPALDVLQPGQALLVQFVEDMEAQ
jgi:hypothetical protein